MNLTLDSHSVEVRDTITGLEFENQLQSLWGLHSGDYYLIHDGKIFRRDSSINSGIVHVIPRVYGGKGGFGSMLRAIGAQIEKTTNREACRDLSGRRLRDINEEQRLKNWIGQQADREKEAKERKKKKLERLCEKPRHEFKDEEYDKERSVLPEVVEDAVLQGLEASSSSKRKATDEKPVPKKKPKLWMDDDLDEEDLETDEDSSDETITKVQLEEKILDVKSNHEDNAEECRNTSKDSRQQTVIYSLEEKSLKKHSL
ncbi:unnamed protein product [Phaedon cochleariae]|uniref:SDE2-like domain-containing protein n=1 Tax=Phaedon cochleariae TaxID=80249 RepID=A0A9P0DTI4_PHACE|nr:unnamed protein product [Phaedon cochleariae]